MTSVAVDSRAIGGAPASGDASREVFDAVVSIIKPYAKNLKAVDEITMESDITDELQVNSSRMVDILIDIEDRFELEVSDDEADEAKSIGDIVRLILAKHVA